MQSTSNLVCSLPVRKGRNLFIWIMQVKIKGRLLNIEFRFPHNNSESNHAINLSAGKERKNKY